MNLVSVVLFIIGLVACFIFDITPILLVIFGGIVGIISTKSRRAKPNDLLVFIL